MKGGTNSINTRPLEDLLNQAIKETSRGELESIYQIKQLVKQLSEQAFLAEDAKGFAKIIELSKQFAMHCYKNNKPQYIASVFEIYAQDYPLAKKILETNNSHYLTWLFVKRNYLEEFARKKSHDGSNILNFENAIFKELNLTSTQCLPTHQSVLTQLNNAVNAEDYGALKLCQAEINILLQDAFDNDEPSLVADLLKQIIPLCEKAFIQGRYDLLTAIFNISAKDITQIKHAFDKNAKDLLLWYLIDSLELENFAKHSPWQAREVQRFKTQLYQHITGKANLLTPAIKTAQAIRAAALKKQVIDQELMKNEAEAFFKETFLNNEPREFARALNLLYEYCLELYKKKDLKSLADLLELDDDELEAVKMMLDAKEHDLFKYFLIQNQDLDEIAIVYSTTLNYSDTSRTNAFKQSVMKELSLVKGRLVPTSEELDQQITKAVSKKEISSEALEVLGIKMDYALQNAYQQNNIEEYHKIILQLSRLAQYAFDHNKALEFGQILNMPNTLRDQLLVFLQRKDTKMVSSLLAQNDLNYHYTNIYSAHPHMLTFGYELQIKLGTIKSFEAIQEDWAAANKAFADKSQQLLSKYNLRNDLLSKAKGVDEIKALGEKFAQEDALEKNLEAQSKPEEVSSQEISFELAEEDPLFWNKEEVHKNWQEKIDDVITKNDLETAIKIRNQAKRRLKEAFIKGDVNDYAKTMKVAMALKDKAIQNKAFNIACAVFELGNDDIRFTRELIKKGSPAFMNWLLIEHHDLDEYAREENIDRSNIHDFVTKVMKKLGVDQNIAIRNVQDISNSLKVNLIKDAKQSNLALVKYHADELECALKNAVQQKSVKNTSEVVQAIVDAIKLAHEQGLYHHLASILALPIRDLDELEQVITAKNDDLLTWYVINSVEVNDYLAQMDLTTDEKIAFKRDVAKMIQPGKETLLKEPNKLLQNIQRALRKEDEAAIDLAMIELEAFAIDCLLTKNAKAYGEMLQNSLAIIQKAMAQNRSDLVIDALSLSEDDAELLHIINERNERNLAMFGLLQNEEFEMHALRYRIPENELQTFKREVHESIVGKDKALVPSFDEIAEQANDTLQTGEINEEDFLVLDAKIQACLEYAYEQKDAASYAKGISLIRSLLQQAFQRGHLDLILERLDIDLQERDAIMVYLQQLDQEGVLGVLVESNLREQEDNILAKGGIPSTLGFRMNVYEQLNVLPKEIYENQDRYAILGLDPTTHSLIDQSYIDWLSQRGADLDIADPYLQRLLPNLVISGMAPNIIHYLQAVNTPQTKLLSNILQEMYIKKHLAHRFALTGTSETNGISMNLEGAAAEDMIKQMQDSFSKYLTNKDMTPYVKQLVLEVYGHKIDDEKLKDLIQKINQDIQAISLRMSEALIKQKLSQNELVNLPVILQSTPSTTNEFQTHAVTMGFFGNIYITADRSRLGKNAVQGIKISQVGKPEQILSVASQHVLSHFAQIIHQLPQHEKFDETNTQQLELQPILTDEMEEQVSSNCTWSSCANMLARQTMLVHLYQLGLSLQLDDKQAWEKAQNVTTSWDQDFVNFDQQLWLAKYLLQDFSQESGVGFDKHALALIVLKMKNNPKNAALVDQITTQARLTEEDLVKAFAHFVNDVKTRYLPKELLEKVDEDMKLKIDSDAQIIVQLYLDDKVSQAKQVYEELVAALQEETYDHEEKNIYDMTSLGVGEKKNTTLATENKVTDRNKEVAKAVRRAPPLTFSKSDAAPEKIEKATATDMPKKLSVTIKKEGPSH